MRWTIYDKTGNIPKCDVHKIEYNGEFMGACNVTCSIKSASPIAFEVGDYLDYRGERFYINYDPSVLKRARKLSVGNAFEYEGVVLNSAVDELVRCDFLDYVLSDNHIHFTALPNFSFYASSVKDLADRLQANLDRIYSGSQKWTVSVHSEFQGETNVNVQIDSMKVWDALALANSTFKANFIIRNRHITIGTSGVTAKNIFKYGKGNGLAQIERTAESEQGIITRLRAYGSSQNIPSRYYNELSGADGKKLVPDNMAVNFLMLPDFPEKSLDPYLDSKNVDALGIREGTVFFDGSGDLEEIYPSIEKMTAAQLSAAGIQVNLDPFDNGNLDEVSSAEQITDNGIKPKEGTFVENFTITLKDLGFDINNHLSAGQNPSISMKNGMCGGREFEILKCVKAGNKYVLTCQRVHDESTNRYFPYKDYNINKNDKFVLLGIEMPPVYIKAASQRLLAAANEYLAKNDFVRYIYSPKVDDLFMARQHDNAAANKEVSLYNTIKEGDMLLFEDADLGITGNITIDSLTISEGESAIPHYEITLRDEKSVGTIEKIQQQIDSIKSNGGMNTEQVSSIIKAYGDKRFLRKDIPDSTNHTIKFLGGAEVGEAIDSFISGKGTILDKNGCIQTDSIEVRNSLKVLELIINQLKGMEGDMVFSPTRKVLSVESIDATTYKLRLDPPRDGDLIPFRDGNIVYSIVNDILTGGNNYYTSYGRILSTNQNEYSITISLYPDNQVPGGKNHIPVAGYNISRRGNDNLLTNKEDAQSWYLSSVEGRLLFLQNVVKPILEDYNYAISIGKFPQIQAIKDIGLDENAIGVMAETIVAQRIYYYDYNGDIVPNIVDRGKWDLSVAQSKDKPYRNVTIETMRPSGTKQTLLEQHGVWRWGCFWGCLVDKTTEEPKWNAQTWTILKGDGTYDMKIVSSKLNSFRRGHIDTVLTASVTHGMEDISDTLETLLGAEIVWFRDSGDAPSDNMWKPTYESGKKLKIHITNSDMPSEFGFKIRFVSFICRVYAPDGVMLAEQKFGFN